MVVWIAQSSKVLVFIREVLGSNPRANNISSVCRLSLVEMWTLVKGWSKMVRACNLHAPTGSDTLRGLVRKRGFEGNFPAVGQVRLLASQEVISLSGRLSCKTWHLNEGAACCRLCGQLYLGESQGFLMINLLVKARRQPLWGDWHLL